MKLEPNIVGQAFIGGEWLAGRGPAWQRNSPAYQTPTWEGRWSDASQVSEAIGAARAAFPEWAESSLEHRMKLCKRFAEELKTHREPFARLIAVETGKPLWEAKTEVAAAIGKVGNSIDAILKRRWTTMEELGDFTAVTRFRPHGVMLVLGPFNLPAHLPGAHIVPALLAGNTVVFKPSELAPATGQFLVECWQRAGLPAGVVNLVQGAAEVATAAVAHDEVDGILFTGSHRVGAAIHRSLAGKPDKVLALEMGGNNPLVVHGTSDIRAAAITTIVSAFITSGQRCTCARRLIVVGEATYARLVDQLVELIPKIRVGLPLDGATSEGLSPDGGEPFMGTLIHAQAAEQMLAAQSQLLADGAQPLVLMQQPGECKALLSPGLLAVGDSPIGDCEHFGPLLLVRSATDLDEAIALAGQTRFGLSAGFIGDRVEDFHYFLHRVRAGVVNWNRQTTGASGTLPFGGVGDSGNHRPSASFAADYCSYPVASLESHTLSEATKPVPGLDLL